MSAAGKRISAADRGHVEMAGPGRLPRYMLLPGDPSRVELMAAGWDKDPAPALYKLHRGAKAAVGRFEGLEIGAWSTGIGGPSAEVAFAELLELGADIFIRVGSTGALREDMAIGDIVINDAHMRLDGTSAAYAPGEFPAANDIYVTMALVQACEELGLRYHLGTGCTTSSFYAGQFRPGPGGFFPPHMESGLEEMKALGVINFEMEGAALSTLARLCGKRFGMCAAVVAQRCTGLWEEGGEAEKAACLAGAKALRILASWDEAAAAAGKSRYYPGL